MEKRTRNAVIVFAMNAGESPAAIGRAVGLTGVRIRQIYDELTGSRPLYCVCETCGREFRRHHTAVGRFCGYACVRPLGHPDAFIEQARRLWLDGNSITEIGRRMGVTRNAIVGVAHRNDFPARPSPIKRAGPACVERAEEMVSA